MAKSLSDIVGLVKRGDDEILEEQEKTNKTLESIDRNMKAFLAGQRNSRLDDLESSREKKRGGGGGFIKAGAMGAALGAGANVATGDSINTASAIAIGAAGLAITKALSRVAKKMLGSLSNELRGIRTRLKVMDADIKIRLDNLDKADKLRAAEIDKIKTDAEKARKAFDAEKARLEKMRDDGKGNRGKKIVEEKIRKAEADELKRAAAEKARAERIAEAHTH